MFRNYLPVVRHEASIDKPAFDKSPALKRGAATHDQLCSAHAPPFVSGTASTGGAISNQRNRTMKYRRTMPLIFALAFQAALAQPIGQTPPTQAPAVGPVSSSEVASPWPSEVSIPLTHRLKFTSAINGKTYVLRIQVPSFAPPPPQGYPVVYVLDGDQYFGAITDINLSMPQHAVAVGIGYDLINEPSSVTKIIGRKAGEPIGVAEIGRAGSIVRNDDLTLPIAPENRKPDWQELEKIGGMDAFLKVIEDEIKPKVASVAPVDAANATLFGHSAGGTAVLHALFTEPKAFRTFVSASPAIWWNARSVLADEAVFAKLVEARGVSPHILITVGSLEEPKDPRSITPSQRAFLDSLPPDRRAQILAYKKKSDSWGGMVTNARNLGTRLGQLQGDKNYRAQFVLFQGEDHESAGFAALSRGMHFALDN